MRQYIVSTRIAQWVKAWICNLRIAGLSPTAGWVFSWYGVLASLSLQIASVGSDHHAEKIPSRQNHFTVVNDPPLPFR